MKVLPDKNVKIIYYNEINKYNILVTETSFIGDNDLPLNVFNQYDIWIHENELVDNRLYFKLPDKYTNKKIHKFIDLINSGEYEKQINLLSDIDDFF